MAGEDEIQKSVAPTLPLKLTIFSSHFLHLLPYDTVNTPLPAAKLKWCFWEGKRGASGKGNWKNLLRKNAAKSDSDFELLTDTCFL